MPPFATAIASVERRKASPKSATASFSQRPTGLHQLNTYVNNNLSLVVARFEQRTGDGGREKTEMREGRRQRVGKGGGREYGKEENIE